MCGQHFLQIEQRKYNTKAKPEKGKREWQQPFVRQMFTYYSNPNQII
jgi:hypothetical protein